MREWPDSAVVRVRVARTLALRTRVGLAVMAIGAWIATLGMQVEDEE